MTIFVEWICTFPPSTRSMSRVDRDTLARLRRWAEGQITFNQLLFGGEVEHGESPKAAGDDIL